MHKEPISQTHPEIACQALGWNPDSVTSGSDKKLSWKCHRGHEWNATVYNRTKNGSGCPFCAGQRVEIGVNDLATKFPDLAAQADDWDPRSEAFGSAHKKAWKCDLGHRWIATILSRTQGAGCPYCAGQKILYGFNDLSTTHPKIAAEADGWDATKFGQGTHKKMLWRCHVGHQFEAQIANRTNGTGCPYCAGRKVLVGFNDIATTHPEIAAEANGWDPALFSIGSKIKKDWKCSLGHIWQAVIYSRKENSCPICSNRKLQFGFNDLSTTHRELSKEAHGWDPKEVMAGDSRKLSWRCKENHIWVATPASRSGRGTGCPTCSSSGFDPNSDAWLYLLSHEKWNLMQIGITNFPESRLSKHSKLGWELVDMRGPMEGWLVRNWESDVLKLVGSKGWQDEVEKVAGKFDGYTECWHKKEYAPTNLKEVLKLVMDSE